MPPLGGLVDRLRARRRRGEPGRQLDLGEPERRLDEHGAGDPVGVDERIGALPVAQYEGQPLELERGDVDERALALDGLEPVERPLGLLFLPVFVMTVG
jgi:hypothetical protein